ncbi:MAG: transcription elongation factor GreB [Thiomonas sp. 20-64-5]|nr:MAG: transcription elongation factor GreB [Thiomonas sp. 20-64-5]
MNKAFVREDSADAEDDDGVQLPPLPPGGKNYISPQGYARLRAELKELVEVERPKVVEIVSWAAKNGDRSENGDYIYGKKRLREIDRRLRFLTKRLDIAEVVDASLQHGNEQIFFGATVRYADDNGEEHTITIVGIDETEPLQGRISWISPVARALLKAREGDSVSLPTPGGTATLEILEVRYPPRP